MTAISGVPGAEEEAPFVDGWPTSPALTVTLNGKPILAAPLMNERQSFFVGPYKVWVNL